MSLSMIHGASAQAEFAATLLAPDRCRPLGLHTWNGSDPAVRLAVYRNNVVSSLIDALAETFPVVQQLVGEEFFRAMAGVFVRESPPRSRILAFYGQAFPTFVGQFEPAQGLPYLGDMAQLEALRVQAYHAADAEPVAAEEVTRALACGDRTAELRLICHPSVFTIASRYAVVSLWAAHQIDGDIQPVDVDAAEFAVVLRDGLDVLVLRAAQGTVGFLAAVQRGLSLGDAAADAAATAPSFDLTATLSLLLRHGALSAIHLPQRPL